MAIVRATVVLENKSGAAIDESRNVWHFATAAVPTAGELNNIGLGLGNFYDSLSGFLSPALDRGIDKHRVEMATVAQGGPGEPDDVVSKLIATRAFSTTGSTGTSKALPHEVAVCISWKGDLEGVPEEQGLIRPASRKRGRIFFGPLNAGILAQETTSLRAIVDAAFRAQVITTYDTLRTQLANASGKVRHVIYSRAAATVAPVEFVSVDDAFDTQRSRGERRVFKTESGRYPVIEIP